MSRVLRFRIWDKANKEYMILGATGLDARNGDVIDYYNEGNRLGGPEKYDVEQYTGLKDKNGKEIYEGDILGGMFEGCYIGWCDTTKSFELFNCYEHYCMACDGDILWCELSDSDIDLEVIGNIHENKELIDGSN